MPRAIEKGKDNYAKMTEHKHMTPRYVTTDPTMASQLHTDTQAIPYIFEMTVSAQWSTADDQNS